VRGKKKVSPASRMPTADNCLARIEPSPSELSEGRERNEARDLKLLNKAADELAHEIEDVLRYQTEP